MREDSLTFYNAAVQAIADSNYESALTYLEKSVNLSPHFKSYEKMSVVYKTLGKMAESKSMIAKAYQLNPDNDKTAFLYAQALFATGDFAPAKRVLDDIVLRNSTYRPAIELLKKLK